MKNELTFRPFSAMAHWAVLTLIWGFILIKAALQFFLHYDTLAYHIPAALHAWGMTTYQPEPMLVDVINGIPPLAHWLQGALIFLTGRMSAANLINPLSLLGSAAIFHWLSPQKNAARWFLTLVLAVPMLVLHCLSSYIDLWSGSCLFVAFITLAALQSERTSNAFSARKRLAVLAVCVLALAAACNSKYQAWPIVLVLGAWLLPFLLRAKPRRAAIALAVIGLMLGSYTPARNYLRFGNPTFPISNPIFKSRAAFSSVDLGQTEALQRQMPEYLWGAPQWQRFGESVFEMNRLQSDSGTFRWSIDQAGGEQEWKSPNHRMGGWFWITVFLFILVCTRGLLRKVLPLSTGLMLLTCVVTAALCPQSHELRYWLFLPLSAAGLSAWTLQSETQIWGTGFKLLFAAAAIYVCAAILSPFQIKSRPASAYAPEQAVAFWNSQKKESSSKVLSVCNAKPYAIFWSGPEFNSYRVQDSGNAPQ